MTKIETNSENQPQAEAAPKPAPAHQYAGASATDIMRDEVSERADSAVAFEEIEMLEGGLPDANIEPGVELTQSLESIPQKMAFKIGEAADMVGVKQYVLRYWETEFEMLRPRKSKNNQRVYSRRDVETAMMIKKLLYQDRFSIEGARSALRHLKTQVKEDRGVKVMVQSQDTAVAKLRSLVTEIRRIRELFA